MSDADTVQFIMRDGEPEWAIVPYNLFRRLVDMAERMTQVSKEQAQDAVDEIRNQARLNGLGDMTAEQVDEIIQNTRSGQRRK